MADEKTLKDCPFCGSSDIDPEGVFFYDGGDKSKPINAPACNSCNATSGKTIQDWNTRISKPNCKTCDGRGEIGGFCRGDNAYTSEPCPECTRPVSTPAIPSDVSEAVKILNHYMGLTSHPQHIKPAIDTVITAATSSQSLRDETFEAIATEAVADCDTLVDRCTALETENTALRERVKGMEACLDRAAKTFRYYQESHLCKYPPDYTKADANKSAAEDCETYRGKEASDAGSDRV